MFGFTILKKRTLFLAKSEIQHLTTTNRAIKMQLEMCEMQIKEFEKKQESLKFERNTKTGRFVSIRC